MSGLWRCIQRVVGLWCLTVEGKVTWWCSDDVHFRERKVDWELRIPPSVLRPGCWLGGHQEHYGRCVMCDKAMVKRR